MGSPVALPPAARSQIPDWLIAVLLWAATALLFSGALANGFVNYDDPDYVTANRHVQAGLTAGSIRWALTASVASNWHPLTWWSHLGDQSLFGGNPHGHHATSVLLHALNAALAFLAFRRLTGERGLSVCAAVLFAVHPLRVESVAWVAERKDVLSGLFFFLCLWAYAAYAHSSRGDWRRVGWYFVALAACALGLMAKPMLVTLPCVLLLLDVWPLGRWSAMSSSRFSEPRDVASAPSRSWGRDAPVAFPRSRFWGRDALVAFPRCRPRGPDALVALPRSRFWGRDAPVALLAEKLPFFALALASALVTYHVQAASGAVTAQLSFGARAANALVAVVRYVLQALWPAKLAVLYPHPGHWPVAFVTAAGLLIATLTLWALLQARRRPWLATGWLWFIGMLVPVIGLVQVGLQSMADRYTYLPLFGVEIIMLWLTRDALGRRARLPLVIATAAFALMTVRQVTVWKDSVTLFTHTLATAGDGNYLAYDNRGIALQEAGRTDAAVADYERALAIKPDYPNANNNLARVLAARGQLPAAIAHFEAALRANPNLLEAHNNLANALSDAGRLEEAIAHYRFVLEREPDHVNALNGYAAALAMKGNIPEAQRTLERVLQIAPENLSALSNLGNVYAMSGRRQEAAQLYQRALAREPGDAHTHFNLANVYAELGRLDLAAAEYGTAVRLAPVNPDVHAALGLTLARLGRRAEAIQQLQIALQQRPDHPQARAWLQAVEHP